VQSKKHTSKVTTGTPKHSGIPCATVLTVSFVLSRVIGLSCHPRLRLFRKLDLGVERSGPHDFSVRRKRALVSRALSVRRIPRPTFVTRRPPLLMGARRPKGYC
jgi:hypothetical protein